MGSFQCAALAAKIGALVIAVSLAGCAGDDNDDTTAAPSSASSGVGGGDGGAGAQGGSSDGGASSSGGQGGGGADVGPCGEDCSVYGPKDNPCYIGVCNEGEFPGPVHVCTVVSAPQGTACDDGLFCTANDTCDDGLCVGGPQNTCNLTLESCAVITCDETTESCSQAPADENSACVLDGSDKCEVNGKCTAGACVGVPKDCSFSPLTECNLVTCNPANGACEGVADPAKEGTACTTSGDLCLVNKTCQAGACGGGVPKDCSALTVGCNNGVCDANSGSCISEPVAPGGSCAEGDDACNDGICNANAECIPTPKANGTACNDFSFCTTNDSCSAGVCDGQPVAGCLFYLTSDFESCPQNWTLVPDWECGTPTKMGGPAPNGGTGVMVTKLATNYTNGWDWNENIYAESPPINLTNATYPLLSYWAWFSTDGGNNDGVNLKITTDNGVTWTTVIDAYPSYNLPTVGVAGAQEPAWGDDDATGWRNYVVDLSSYVGEVVKLRFQLRTDSSGNKPGFYVDDLNVGEGSQIQQSIVTPAILDAAVNVAYVNPLDKLGGSATGEWSIIASSNAAWLSIDPDTGELSGTPAAADAGPASVTVRVVDPADASNLAEATYDFDVNAAIAYSSDFEGACPNGWTLTGEFQCGAVIVQGTTPKSAISGTQVLATKLGGLYSNSLPWGNTSATSPAFDLTGSAAPKLQFYAWIDTEGSSFDGVNVKVSTDGGTTYNIASSVIPAYPLTVSSQSAWGGRIAWRGWQLYEVSLAGFVGANVRVKIDFRSDVSNVGSGVYVDNLVVFK